MYVKVWISPIDVEKQCVYLSGVACKNRVLKGDPCLHVFAGIDIYKRIQYMEENKKWCIPKAVGTDLLFAPHVVYP